MRLHGSLVYSILAEERDNRTHEFISIASSTTESSKDVEVSELSEIQDLVQLSSELITNLFRISSKVRTATPRDRYLRAATALPELKEQFAFWDNSHVLNKYKKLRSLGSDQQWLPDRLGRAITWRRQYLRYCEDHSVKISTVNSPKIRELPLVPHLPEPNTYIPEVAVKESSPPRVSPPSVTTLTTPSTFVEEKPVQSDTRVDNPAEEAEEFAPSAHATSVGTVEGESPAIIRLEKVRKANREFLCPFCTLPQKFRLNQAWR